MAKTLYICYFGLREPLVQTQVLPYLHELLKDGHEISLLTFEPDLAKNWTPEQISDEKSRLLEAGIDWHCLAYHKRPSALATAYDILRGALWVRRTIRDRKIDILHGRAYVPTLIGAIARKGAMRNPKLLFDIRGFMPEEYTDAGIWPRGGLLYRTTKYVERWLLNYSDGFVVLTEKAREILFSESKSSGFDKFGRPVEMIPCCVDLHRFAAANDAARNAMRPRLGIMDRNVIVYVGSLGGWYLTDEMLDFFEAARAADPSTFVLVLTQRDKAKVAENLRKRGFSPGDFLVDSVGPEDIPAYLAASDISVSFIKACYSKLSSSPTKIAEYLAAGLPILANSGVGDVDHLIENKQTGVLVRSFDRRSYSEAFRKITLLAQDKKAGEGRRRIALESFDLETVGGERYRRLYKALLGEA